MTKSQSDILKKIEGLSSNYECLIKKDTLAYKKAKSWETIRNDWWLAYVFFLDRAFYQGRNDDLSAKFEESTLKALGEILVGTSSAKFDELGKLKNAGWLEQNSWDKPEGWETSGNPLCVALNKEYDIDLKNGLKKLYRTGKVSDKKMILSSLKYITGLKDYNIVEHAIEQIMSGQIASLHKEIDTIFSVGPDKIAPFVLRDVVFCYGLESCLKTEDDYAYVIPIDTWVNQICKEIGIKPNRLSIAQACLNNGVSPIKFDQGAWILGSHPLEILKLLTI